MTHGSRAHHWIHCGAGDGRGMLRCGLQAAAQLPFLPTRAGLGSSVPDFWDGELKTVRSPYPSGPGDAHEELIAMPACASTPRSSTSTSATDTATPPTPASTPTSTTCS